MPDRIYLNGYVPSLQVGGQMVSFMRKHLGYPIPSPPILEKIGTRFRKNVKQFADDHSIPVVRFGKGDRKIDVMRPHLDRQAATGRSGVAAIGVAQEYQNVFAGTQRPNSNGAPWYALDKADRRVTCFGTATSGRRSSSLRLLPVSDQGSGSMGTMGQTAGQCGRHRVYRAVQRVRLVHRSCRPAGDLRPAWGGRDRGVQPATRAGRQR